MVLAHYGCVLKSIAACQVVLNKHRLKVYPTNPVKSFVNTSCKQSVIADPRQVLSRRFAGTTEHFALHIMQPIVTDPANVLADLVSIYGIVNQVHLHWVGVFPLAGCSIMEPIHVRGIHGILQP